jgi:6-phosphogluconolactonase
VKPSIQLEIFEGAQAAAEAAAGYIAEQASVAVAARGRFLLAVSGGRTPWLMLAALATRPLPWSAIEVFQVDERVAPAGDPDRNLVHLREALLRRAPLQLEHVHAMRVESPDLAGASRDYAAELESHAGTPPVLDLVHLGLGPDGHTASLVPDDPSLDVSDADVTLSGPYQGHRRMTLTYPVIDRARRVLWVVTGAEKAAMLRRLLDGDRAIPAGRVRRDRAIAFVDRDAAGDLERAHFPGRNGAVPARGIA